MITVFIEIDSNINIQWINNTAIFFNSLKNINTPKTTDYNINPIKTRTLLAIKLILVKIKWTE
ncbi:hypothetical protein BK008_07030 [Methanobacterium sp. MZ-A1]|jgi:hypothetical protein|nr:hypothetical protein BK008_07030 [Methanobacterium sp. MZ-A1]PKL73357.1 MAG: hypothetical protein CVV29_03910 [Methanobacteriales archaeon HGW-Methanobacteriales-2]